MLGRLPLWRHVAVAISIVVCSVLAFLGIIGGEGEHFDAKHITISPAGDDGVRIREVVDEDFGLNSRHGYQRLIPNDAGLPTDVEASSPNANADLDVVHYGDVTQIRLGDASTTYRGKHRYILEYTLPDARTSSGELNIDVIDAGEEFPTDRFEVIVTGFDLDDPVCNVGPSNGSTGGCELSKVGDDYHVVFEPLGKGDGVNVRGTIVGQTDPSIPPLPALPKSNRLLLGLLMIPLGLLAWGFVYFLARRSGRNEVFDGGAADAAFGMLPTPRATASVGAAFANPVGGAVPTSTHLVADSKMKDLATIEFVPPRGVDPWQGSVLLTERLDNNTVAAWFSGLAASEAITLRNADGGLVVGVGPKLAEADPSSAQIVQSFLSGRQELTLGKYDASFAAAWSSVRAKQSAFIHSSGWWRRHAPSSRSGAAGGFRLVIAIVVALIYLGSSVASAAAGLITSWWAAVGFGLIVPAITAAIVYATLLPSRSASGSALALLTESFRRFLAGSEGKHVDWAWKNGLLREYSAWAVALGEADAWGKALAGSNVPAPEYNTVNPLLVYSMGSAFAQTRTAPSSSGGGGSGFSSGFSGGGVGGGGGGGSSGSW